MPELSRFFGIVITMYARDHPPPHFHARYGEHEALVDVENSQLLRGSLSRRAQDIVDEWSALHRAELRTAWEALRSGRAPAGIAPLE
ncbi:DUF4160 domain-containing protein [Candidatus Poriferisodalis sp.]|uniref:DUF4160 domain-containing protein n=1 Tax=Candidatus Poriferisodalis sp. TaxID=3101277 RepID=UPI003B51A99A